MRTTSPSRRVAALVGAGTVGLSTAFLCAAGTASASPTPFTYTDAADHVVTVPSTACAVTWDVTGASGGTTTGGAGGAGDEVTANTAVVPGSTLFVEPGQQGSSGGAGGTSGTHASGGHGGAGAGGGGGASIVRSGSTATSPLILVAAGGGGAGTQAAGGAAESDGSDYAPGADTYGGGGGAWGAGGAAGVRNPGTAPGSDGSAGTNLTGATGPVGAGGGGGGQFGGGSGASDGTNGAGGGGGASYIADFDSPTGQDIQTASAAAGSVMGTFVTCTPAGQPEPGQDGPVQVQAGDGAISVTFSSIADNSGDPRAARATGWQISTDGGSTWGSTITADGSIIQTSIGGLTNGHAYAVEVRSVSAVGTGTPTTAVSATPHHVVGAPSNFAATVGGGSITLTWAPPAGETGITGYQAWALPGEDPQSNSGIVQCPDMDAAGRTCTLQVEPGQKYSVSVVAVTDQRGAWATLVTGLVPAPQTVPAGDGPLSSAAGALSTVTAGQQVTLTGSGYAPGSTVELYIYSSPTALGQVTVDAAGKFSATVTVPADLEPGAHHLVAAGTDLSGHVRYLRVDVTLSDAGQLAWTGFEAAPFVGVGVLALAVGGALFAVSRKRRTV